MLDSSAMTADSAKLPAALEAVLWDNDGVLVETESLFFEVTRAAFGRLGIVLTKDLWATRYLAEGKPESGDRLGAGGGPADRSVLKERNEEYRGILSQPPSIRPHVRETLQALSGRVRMAIVTGCDRAQLDQVHASSELLRFFEFIVTSDDCPHPKPHPELYLTALRSLDLSPSNCIAVEDSPVGWPPPVRPGLPASPSQPS